MMTAAATVTIITRLDGAPLAEVDAGDDDPDAAIYRAIELAGEHGGSVLLRDSEGLFLAHSCGHVDVLYDRSDAEAERRAARAVAAEQAIYGRVRGWTEAL